MGNKQSSNPESQNMMGNEQSSNPESQSTMGNEQSYNPESQTRMGNEQSSRWEQLLSPQFDPKYSEYMMLTGSSEKTPFLICDSPGFGEELPGDVNGLQAKVMESIIMGKFISGEKINYTKMTLEELAQRETKQECAVCVFFVIDIRRVNIDMMKTSDAFKSMKYILDFVQRKDIKAAFLLTNCDNFNDKVKKKPKHIYMSKSIEEKIRIVSEIFDRFSINRIFPIVNDTEIIGTNNDLMAQSLIALRQVMGDISSYLTKRVDIPANIELH